LKLIILGAYYLPEIAAHLYLIEDIARGMAQAGHEVHILTAMPTRGLDGQTMRQYRGRRLESQLDGRLTIHRVRVPIAPGKGTLRRALRYGLITLAVSVKALALRGDVMLAYSTPPTLPIVIAPLAKLARVPVALYLQDMFPESLLCTGMMREGFMLSLLRGVQSRMLRRVARVITISQDFVRHVRAQGVPQDRVELVYNWVDCQAIAPIARADNILVKRYALDPALRYVTYCGNVGHTQQLETMVDAAASLRDLTDVMFLIIGDGARLAKVQAYAHAKALPNLRFLPFQSAADMAHVLSLGDIGVVTSKPGTGNSSFPVKTWFIMAAARPVLCAFDGDSELSALVDEARAGVCIAPGDSGAFANALRALLADPSAMREMGANGRRFVESRLSREAGVAALRRVLTELGGERV